MRFESKVTAWLVVAALFGMGCSSKSSTPASAPNPPLASGQCRTVTDCEGNQVCQAATLPEPGLNLTVAAPCPMVACSSDEQCAGQLCQSTQGVAALPNCFGDKFCGVACTAGSCMPGWTCASDGHCVLLPCTDPAFAGCPQTMYCDEAAAADPNPSLIGLDPAGSNGRYASLAELQAGCRQLRCDEPEGPMCSAGWLCEPEVAGPTNVGCRPIPCAEYGHCSNDMLYICEPTSTNSRYDGVDAHGCFRRNCEEGEMCAERQVCDFTRPEVNLAGCSFIQCNEPMGSCPVAGEVCDPDYQAADVFGCRLSNCNEGQTCTAPATCDPADPTADSIGCVHPYINPNPVNPTDPINPADPTDPTDPADPVDLTDPDPPQEDPGAPLGSACAVDADCERGYCVERICRSIPGQCQ